PDDPPPPAPEPPSPGPEPSPAPPAGTNRANPDWALVSVDVNGPPASTPPPGSTTSASTRASGAGDHASGTAWSSVTAARLLRGSSAICAKSPPTSTDEPDTARAYTAPGNLAGSSC